tara:strand:- start:4401 stop:5057 length:657 start_codon:yes stop_codon:yes gene_type:complete
MEEKYTVNPARFTLEWAGGKDAGKFKYYDKEKKENVFVDGIEFVKLEEAHSISGYSKQFGTCFSNEAQDHNVSKHVQIFKDGGPEVVLSGTWKDIKYEAQGKYGAKFTGVIYASTINCTNSEIEDGSIVRVLVKGCSLTPWIEFGKSHKGAKSVKCTGAKDHKTGDIQFRSPIFEAGEGSPKADVNAQREEVRNFLSEKKAELDARLAQEPELAESPF